MKEICGILDKEDLVYAVLSNKRNAVTKYDKVTVAPFLSKEKIKYQFECFEKNKAIHHNCDNYKKNMLELLPLYKNFALFTDKADYQILIGKKGNINIRKSKPTKELKIKSHNKEKNYYFKDGTKYDFLVHLGIMTQDGRVKPTKYNKFVQINKYIEIIGESIELLDKKEIKIVDFGCGKAYLTFALYYYLTKEKGIAPQIIGIDLKEDVIESCSLLSEKLGYSGMRFISGDISDFAEENIDIAVSLHACDTATDIALIKACNWDCKIIIAVPCCHHQLFDMIDNVQLNPILKYGILKDKFASIVTDSMRGLALQIKGYEVNIMEFTPVENTPKNVLIKAVKTGKVDEKYKQQYDCMKKMLNISPYIDNMIKDV